MHGDGCIHGVARKKFARVNSELPGKPPKRWRRKSRLSPGNDGKNQVGARNAN
jgi:hypothetical protein